MVSVVSMHVIINSNAHTPRLMNSQWARMNSDMLLLSAVVVGDTIRVIEVEQLKVFGK